MPKITMITLALLLMVACVQPALPAAESDYVSPSPVVAEPVAADGTRAAWLPYWEYRDALDEAEALSGKLDTLVAFAALFDTEGGLILPEGLSETLAGLEKDESGAAVYLSVVNDVEQADGTYLSKDAEIIRKVLKSAAFTDKHIEALIKLCTDNGVDGLEIDYENFKNDEALWKSFSTFVGKLYARTKEAGLRLRIVLGAYDYKRATFPKGPDYVVMCYNLYGTHSGPGPKADFDFLKTLCANFKVIPGAALAFANGGFDWDSEGGCVGITEVQAENLIEAYQVRSVSRDSASGALSFTYKKDGVSHEVWYADCETIAGWIECVKPLGYEKISLWRLAGNRDSGLKTLFDE